jgi:cytochrome c oxidase subunit II
MTAMAVGLRLALIMITLACLWLFTAHPWWLPTGASSQAADVDRGFKTAWWLLGILFVFGQLVLALLIRRSRSSDTPVRAPHKNWHGSWGLEVAWIAAIAMIFFWFHLSGASMWSQMMASHTQGSEVQVEVTGVQFQWYFRYPGPDGIFGRVNAQKFARPEEGNPLGIDPGDAAGRDDVVSSTLVLPVGQPVQLDLRAQDVIHSVFIPEMRFKQDAVPGMDIRSRLVPTRLGTYEIACAELCGLGHYRMRATVRVIGEEEFRQWLRSQREMGNAFPEIPSLNWSKGRPLSAMRVMVRSHNML